MCGFESVVKKLVEYGIDLDAADAEGNTALHYAARAGFASVVGACWRARPDHQEQGEANRAGRGVRRHRVMPLPRRVDYFTCA